MMNQDSLSAKNNSETKQRVLFAALSGSIAGTTAALLSSFINTWLFPDLPLHLEWSSIFFAWVLWAVLGGILAGVAAFSSEGWKSVLLSALSMAVTILILNFMQSSESTLLNVVVLIGLSLPFTAMMIPLASLFFWLARRFVEAMSLKGWACLKIFLVNFIIILALGALPGVYAKMNAKAERGVRIIHGILQAAAQASSPDAFHKSLLKTEGFADHKDQPYTLSQAPSVYSTVGVDVTAHYDDGYTILCTIVLYPGSDPSIIPCKGQAPYRVPHK
jgi:MFS family permease